MQRYVVLRALACIALSAVPVALAGGVAADGKRMLMLLQDSNHAEQYSRYLAKLAEHGFAVTVKGYRDAGLKLKQYDTWLYDHLAILVPKAQGFGGTITTEGILEFIDSGHNAIIAGSTEVSDTIRVLAAEVGVDMDERGTKVYDHFSHASRADGQPDHTLVVARDVLNAQGVFGSSLVQDPILFRGVACVVPAESELVTVAVSAPYTAYSHDPRKAMLDAPELMAGSSIALVALVQARNNARVLVTGSVDLFSDELLSTTVAGGKTGNGVLLEAVTLWTTQQRGVLRASNLRHRHLDASQNAPMPSEYRVMDDVEFAVDITEVHDGQQRPFQADDMQLEFTMLDPHVRQPLEHDGKGTFSLRFKVPDVYGVFKYVVNYRHRGYSYVELTQQVPVRPFKHNEYERFLVCAYPYYASALSSMLAFFALGVLYLYNK